MPRYRRRSYGKPLRDRPEPVCPTCGQRDQNRLLGWYRHGRPVVLPVGEVYHSRVWRRADRPKSRPIRLRKQHIEMGYKGAALCNDAFHARWWGRIGEPTPPPPPRGRLGHNPDLRAAKAELSRALQGKDRR